jgi:pantoate--beta-alanine ligase
MDRLLNIIKAKYVFMGEKDYQQLFLIKKKFKKKYNSKIIGCPTIRERNKLALSSRNFLLSKKNYLKAGLIAEYLLKFKYLYKRNYKRNHIILNKTMKELENKYKIKIEYLEFRNLKDLKLADFKKKFRLFLAYYINNVRLVDNF